MTLKSAQLRSNQQLTNNIMYVQEGDLGPERWLLSTFWRGRDLPMPRPDHRSHDVSEAP